MTAREQVITDIRDSNDSRITDEERNMAIEWLLNPIAYKGYEEYTIEKLFPHLEEISIPETGNYFTLNSLITWRSTSLGEPFWSGLSTKIYGSSSISWLTRIREPYRVEPTIAAFINWIKEEEKH